MSVSFFMWSSLSFCLIAQALLAYHYFWKKDREVRWNRSLLGSISSAIRIFWPTMVWMFICVPLKTAISISIPARMVFLRDEHVIAVFERPTTLWYWDDIVPDLVDADFHQYREQSMRVEIPLGNDAPSSNDSIGMTILLNATLEDFLLYHRIFGHTPPEEIVSSVMRAAASQCVYPHSMHKGTIERVIRTYMGNAFEAAFADTGMHLITIEIDIHTIPEPSHAPRERGVLAELLFCSVQCALG